MQKLKYFPTQSKRVKSSFHWHPLKQTGKKTMLSHCCRYFSVPCQKPPTHCPTRTKKIVCKFSPSHSFSLTSTEKFFVERIEKFRDAEEFEYEKLIVCHHYMWARPNYDWIIIIIILWKDNHDDDDDEHKKSESNNDKQKIKRKDYTFRALDPNWKNVKCVMTLMMTIIWYEHYP